jgi:hypothetical protein
MHIRFLSLESYAEKAWDFNSLDGAYALKIKEEQDGIKVYSYNTGKHNMGIPLTMMSGSVQENYVGTLPPHLDFYTAPPMSYGSYAGRTFQVSLPSRTYIGENADIDMLRKMYGEFENNLRIATDEIQSYVKS